MKYFIGYMLDADLFWPMVLRYALPVLEFLCRTREMCSSQFLSIKRCKGQENPEAKIHGGCGPSLGGGTWVEIFFVQGQHATTSAHMGEISNTD